jgi:hypothetical protein
MSLWDGDYVRLVVNYLRDEIIIYDWLLILWVLPCLYKRKRRVPAALSRFCQYKSGDVQFRPSPVQSSICGLQYLGV